MTNWLSQLIGETQLKLVRLLRRSPRTISGLSEDVGLTDNAVRTHLTTLVKDGLVEEVGSQRDTGGKPARLYRLTTSGEELFPKAYALVLGELVDEIARERGVAGTTDLLRAVGQRIGSSVARPEDLPSRVAAAANVFRRLGGDIEVERHESGWTLQGYGCPLSAMTTNHPEGCALATALVAEITGQPVTECCERGERPRCRFRIEDKGTDLPVKARSA